MNDFSAVRWSLVLRALCVLAGVVLGALPVNAYCATYPGSQVYLCCDRLLWSATPSAAQPWQVRNLMIEDSQGPTSGDLTQWKSVNPPRFEGWPSSQSRISFSSVNAPGGVTIPELSYVPSALGGWQRPAVWLHTFGSGVGAAYQCSYNETDCPQDGITLGVGFDDGNGAEGWDAPVHSVISPDLNGLAYTDDCTWPPCWIAPNPAINLPNKRSMLSMHQNLSATCNTATGTADNCAGETIYPRWMIATHNSKGWFTGVTQFTITGADIWGCVEPSGEFFTINPCRLFDSRVDGYRQPLHDARRVNAWGEQSFGNCNIPPTARSLVGNLTIVTPVRDGFLRAYRGDFDAQQPPQTQVVSFSAGLTRAASFMVELDAGGAFYVDPDVAGVFTGHAVVDITGYFE